jgi:NitT/TauT family transport system permease protein
MRLTQWHVVRAIIIPSALPEIFTGIRVSFSLTLIGTLLGEMFGSQRGLGYLLMTAIGLQNVRMIMAVTLLLVLFAATVSVALLAVDRRLHRDAG